jgi:hypothetical protein
MHRFFSLDGEREWSFSSGSEDWRLRAEMQTPHDEDGSTTIATIQYTRVETDELLYTIAWSSDSSDGIRVHSFTNVQTGDGGAFSPPVVIADPVMEIGDEIRTSYGDFDVVSVLEAYEACPNHWSADWDCVRLAVSTDRPEAPPFIGTWWLANTWGPSWFQPPGLEEPWILTDAHWSTSPSSMVSTRSR